MKKKTRKKKLIDWDSERGRVSEGSEEREREEVRVCGGEKQYLPLPLYGLWKELVSNSVVCSDHSPSGSVPIHVRWTVQECRPEKLCALLPEALYGDWKQFCLQHLWPPSIPSESDRRLGMCAVRVTGPQWLKLCFSTHFIIFFLFSFMVLHLRTRVTPFFNFLSLSCMIHCAVTNLYRQKILFYLQMKDALMFGIFGCCRVKVVFA